MFHQVVGAAGSFLAITLLYPVQVFRAWQKRIHKVRTEKSTRVKPVTLQIVPSKGVSCRTKTRQTLRRQEGPAGLPVPE